MWAELHSALHMTSSWKTWCDTICIPLFSRPDRNRNSLLEQGELGFIGYVKSPCDDLEKQLQAQSAAD